MEKWFVEEEKSQLRFGVKITEELFHEKSDFQDVKVFKTDAYGRMLTLDDFVMLTERDEFVYHEMISHIAVCLHPEPKTVVVIGGGDGGTVRELLKHKSIEKIVLCEIDALVVEASRKFFPGVASGLEDSRVDVKIADGIAYIKSLCAFADVIIIDSADPVGPGIGLFTGEFYRSVANALKPNGIMIAQSESPWHEGESLKLIYENMRHGFPFVRPVVAPIPTYPRGLWSWTLASQNEIKPEAFDRKRFAEVADSLQFLSESHMEAVFSLPVFYKRKLGLDA